MRGAAKGAAVGDAVGAEVVGGEVSSGETQRKIRCSVSDIGTVTSSVAVMPYPNILQSTRSSKGRGL